jgi:hypothetical protein
MLGTNSALISRRVVWEKSKELKNRNPILLLVEQKIHEKEG